MYITPITGSLSMNNSTVSGNIAAGGSAAAFLPEARLPSPIRLQRQYDRDRGSGGGIAATSNGSITMDNSTVSGNSAGWFGGGIMTEAAPATVRYSTITNNTSDSDNDSVGAGGGAYRACQRYTRL